MSSTPDKPDEGPADPERSTPDPAPAPIPPAGAVSPEGMIPPLQPAATPPYDAAGPVPPPAPMQPAPATRGPSLGGRIGIGVGLGCGAYVLGVVLLFATAGIIGNAYGWLWPFLTIAAVAIVMMFFRRTRGIATGILIASAAAWIVVLGPCLAILNGMTGG